MVAAGNQQPELAGVFSVFNTNTPNIYANIDRVRAEMLGVTPDQVFETLEVYLGSAYVNQFNYLGRTYQVLVQADGPFRKELPDVGLQDAQCPGKMVPGIRRHLEDRLGPYRLPRYNPTPPARCRARPHPVIRRARRWPPWRSWRPTCPTDSA
jgi:HAE1 family hydrophobic/amphiphilic exporter-1